MSKLLAISLQHMRLQWKNRANLVMMFVMPVIFTLLFGKLFAAGGASATPLAVVDLDQSTVSQRLVGELRADKAFAVRTVAAGELDGLVGDAKIEAAVLIPAGYGAGLLQGGRPALDLRTKQESTAAQVGMLVYQHAEQVSRAASVAQTLAGGDAAQAPAAFTRTMDAYSALPAGYTTTAQTRTDVGMTAASGSALGFSVMFVMMSLVAMTGVMIEERSRGTWQRILFSPVSKTQILGGYLLSFVLTGLLQFGILVLLSSWMFGVAWGNPLRLAVVVLALTLAVSGLGLLLAGLLRSAEQQRTIGSLLTVSTSMLGGVFWSLDMVGPAMKKIAYLTPQAWAMDGLREVMLRGGDWSQIALPVAVLLGMAVVFLTAGFSRVRYN